jgi:hypothetical protein
MRVVLSANALVLGIALLSTPDGVWAVGPQHARSIQRLVQGFLAHSSVQSLSARRDPHTGLLALSIVRQRGSQPSNPSAKAKHVTRLEYDRHGDLLSIHVSRPKPTSARLHRNRRGPWIEKGLSLVRHDSTLPLTSLRARAKCWVGQILGLEPTEELIFGVVYSATKASPRDPRQDGLGLVDSEKLPLTSERRRHWIQLDTPELHEARALISKLIGAAGSLTLARLEDGATLQITAEGRAREQQVFDKAGLMIPVSYSTTGVPVIAENGPNGVPSR